MGIYWREKPIVARIRPYLSSVESVIDIGAGGCRVSNLIATSESIHVTAVDVVDHNVTDIPLTLYDGKTLPFPDQTFDVSLLVFVLHHATDPIALLRETVRVTRSAVIIVEDAPANIMERGLWRAWDYALNHATLEDINIAHKARGLEEWKEFLDCAGVSPAEFLTFRTVYPVLRTYTHAMFYIPLSPIAASAANGET